MLLIEGGYYELWCNVCPVGHVVPCLKLSKFSGLKKNITNNCLSLLLNDIKMKTFQFRMASCEWQTFWILAKVESTYTIK